MRYLAVFMGRYELELGKEASSPSILISKAKGRATGEYA
jgi:hypothetical protein